MEDFEESDTTSASPLPEGIINDPDELSDEKLEELYNTIESQNERQKAILLASIANMTDDPNLGEVAKKIFEYWRNRRRGGSF